MKRRDYRRPTMQAVELEHRTQLLQSSPDGSVGAKSSINGWEDGDTTDEDIYM